MSQADRSERVAFLRAQLAHFERLSGPARAREGLRVPLGAPGLDRPLHGGLVRGAMHEIVAGRPGDAAAASGFALALVARLSRDSRAAIVWVVEEQAAWEGGGLYAPGLRLHGLDPAALVLVRTCNAQDSFWAMEEALKCQAPAVVVGEIWGLEKAYDLVASRRLVLAAQKSGTPGLLLAAGMAGGAARLSTGAETRFEVFARAGSHQSSAAGRVPLPGPAAWSVRLAKARAGPNGIGLDRDRLIPVFWDHHEGCFHDAFSLPLAAPSRDRPLAPPTAGGRRKSA